MTHAETTSGAAGAAMPGPSTWGETMGTAIFGGVLLGLFTPVWVRLIIFAITVNSVRGGWRRTAAIVAAGFFAGLTAAVMGHR